jgi:ferric-dicitrate binding protein FerR (iron transport regulator)
MDQSPNNKMIADEFLDDEKLKSALLDVVSQRNVWQRIQKDTTEGKVVPMKRRWITWVAAAAVIIVTGYVLWVTSIRKSEVGGKKYEVAKTHDVPAPANTRAVITLADGSKVYLDSAGNGVLAQQNNVNVVKNEKGEIVYSPNHQITPSPIAYNILFNPRGSKVISLTLSDGTKVWLNAESSLKYPTAFTSNTREVEITGEAYFEVKHNAKQPFKVHLPNGSIVEDIGTSFNINAYPDEESLKTTLIEGSVRVVGGDANKGRAITLKPGEQSVLSRTSPDHQVTTSPDIDEVMAWKNGVFSFNDADLKTVMRQIARWYDVDVEYQGNVPMKSFKGEIDRNVPASKVLQMLEYAGVHFKIEGKKVIVMK